MNSFNKRGASLVVSLFLFLLAFSAFYFAYGSNFIPKYTGFDSSDGYGGGGGTKTCYGCTDTGQVKTKTVNSGDSCGNGFSTNSEITCSGLCYACDSYSNIRTEYATGTPSVDCSKLVPIAGGDPWSSTKIDFCYPWCYACNSDGTSKTERLASCSPPTWSSKPLACGGTKTCSRCNSQGKLDTLTNQVSCSGDYQESPPSSCPILCEQCDYAQGKNVIKGFSVDPSSAGCSAQVNGPGTSAWKDFVPFNTPPSCPKLVNCYWCSNIEGSKPLITLPDQASESCKSPFYERPVGQSPDECPQTCFKCDTSTGKLLTEHKNSCSSGYSPTRPSSCGTCYACIDGEITSKTLPASESGCSSLNNRPGDAWSFTSPSPCNNECYACKADGSLDTRTDMSSCTGGYSSTKPSKCDGTCYVCGLTGLLESYPVTIFTSSDPDTSCKISNPLLSATKPSSCPITCQKCNADATSSPSVISGLASSIAEANTLCGAGYQNAGYPAPTSCKVTCAMKLPDGTYDVKINYVAPNTNPPCPPGYTIR